MRTHGASPCGASPCGASPCGASPCGTNPPGIRPASRLLALCLALLLLTVSVSAALSGCHGRQERATFAVPESFDETREYEIVFWAKNDTNIRQSNIYKRAVSEFESLYPNIHIKLSLYTDYGQIYNDVITNIPTGTTPHICISYPDHIATYMTGENTVVPLSDLMAHPVYGLGGSGVRFDAPGADEIVEKYRTECELGGEQWALPFMRSTEACYVNRNYVEKLGFTLPEVLTWDFIWEVSEAAMQKNEGGTFFVNGQNVLIPFIYKSTDNMMIQYLKQAGADYSTSTGEIGLFNDTTEQFLYTVAEHAGTRAFSTFKISSYPANFLNRGQCLFAVDSTAGSTWMGTDAPLSDISADAVVHFDTVVYPVPQVDPENPAMISQGPSVCLFNKQDPQEVLAAWLFLQYLLTDGIQTDYAKTEGYVPVTTTARESDSYRDYLSRGGEDTDTYYQVKIDATNMLIAHTDDTFVTPVFNGSTSLRNAAGQLIEEVTRARRAKETVDDAFLQKLKADVTALYRLNQSGATAGVKADLGRLPGTSVALLSVLGGAWLVIAAVFTVRRIRRRAGR